MRIRYMLWEKFLHPIIRLSKKYLLQILKRYSLARFDSYRDQNVGMRNVYSLL